MILSVKVLISIKYNININGADFCTVINSAPFSHLNLSNTPGNHQWSCAAPSFSRRGVPVITGVQSVLWNVNRSSVNVFITTIQSRFAEESTCTLKYINEASVLYIFVTLDVRGMKDIRLIFRPILAPSHELEGTDSSTLLTKVVSKRTFVELLSIREKHVYSIYWV
jgi:hypothetical protein